MKKLKSIGYRNSTAICDFVNKMGIKQEDIQQIVMIDGFIEVFYWEEEE